jgi:hypothetical protein
MTVPRCPAPRRDGRPCGTLAASPDARFCKKHEALAEKWGEARVLSGDYPGNVPKARPLLSVDPPEPATFIEANGNEATIADPCAIRPALAQLAAANLSELQRSLLDAALDATTTRWATVYLLRLWGALPRRASRP